DIYEVAVPGQELTMFVALVGNKTLLASPGKDYVVGALRQARLQKKPALRNRAFGAVLEKLDPKQGVSLAMLGTSIGKGEWLDMLPRTYRDALAGIDSIGGGLKFGDDIRLDLAVSTRTEADAQVLREALTKGVALGRVSLALLGNNARVL